MGNTANLIDHVSIQIDCNYCQNKIVDHSALDALDVAGTASDYGWQVNKSGKVKCNKCVKKMKRKK